MLVSGQSAYDLNSSARYEPLDATLFSQRSFVNLRKRTAVFHGTPAVVLQADVTDTLDS